MKRGLLLRAVVAVGALAMPVVTAPSASAVTTNTSVCANFTGGANFGHDVGITPTDTNFALYFDCHAVGLGGPTTMKYAKTIMFQAMAPLEWCNGSTTNTGIITGSAAATPITGTFAFTKTPNHYELTGEFTKGLRRVAVHVSGNLSHHYPALCGYETARFNGTAVFYELTQPQAHFAALTAGTMVMTPGLTPLPAPNSFSMMGTAIGAIGGQPTTCDLMLGGGSSSETTALGLGTVSGACSGPVVSTSCTGTYVRTGALMQVLADCPEFDDGVLTMSVSLVPTNGIPITSAAFSGSFHLQ